MSWLYLSITYEILTKLQGQMSSTRVFEQMVTSRDSMSLANRCDANSDCMLVIVTDVMSWLNLSITYELLTNL